MDMRKPNKMVCMMQKPVKHVCSFVRSVLVIVCDKQSFNHTSWETLLQKVTSPTAHTLGACGWTR